MAKDTRQRSTSERCEEPAARPRADVRHVNIRFASNSLRRRPTVRWDAEPSLQFQDRVQSELIAQVDLTNIHSFYDLSKVCHGLELGVEDIHTQKRTKKKERERETIIFCFQRVREAHADQAAAAAEVALAVHIATGHTNAWSTQITPDLV